MRFIRQSNDLWFGFGVAKSQKTDTPRTRESFRFRGSWLEQQRITEPFCSRLIRVTEDTDIGVFTFKRCAAVFRHLPAFVQNMTDGDAAACQFDHDLRRQFTLVEPINIVVGHCDRGSALSLTFRMPDPWSRMNRRWLQIAEGLSSTS